MPIDTDREHYTAGEVAQKLGVTAQTICLWASKGVIRGKRWPTPQSNWRFHWREVERMAAMLEAEQL